MKKDMMKQGKERRVQGKGKDILAESEMKKKNTEKRQNKGSRRRQEELKLQLITKIKI